MERLLTTILLSCFLLTGCTQEPEIIGEPIVNTAVNTLAVQDGFPEPKTGMKRIDISVSNIKRNSNKKIEVQIGQYRQVDCNKQRFTGELEEKKTNSGKSYYELANLEGPIITAMGCIPEIYTEELVKVFLDEPTVNYKDYPVTVYVPNEFVVEGRVWVE